MTKVRLKPSIPLLLDNLGEGRWRATLLYDGGRGELEIELDESGLDMMRTLTSAGLPADDPRLESLFDRRMLLDVESLASLEDEGEVHRQTLLFCELAADGDQLREALAAIKAATVAIVGLGGIGSNIFDALLRMGFETFLIVDSDMVARSNLNRQRIYTQEDVGSWKTDAAIAYARKVNPQARVRAFRIEVQDLPAACLDGALIVNCADRPSIQATSEMLMDRNPGLVALLVGGGYFCETSFAGPLLTVAERSLLDRIGEREGGPASHQRAVGGNSFSSAVLPASVGAFEILRYVTGLGKVNLRRTMMVFDWRELAVQLISLG